MALDKQFLKYKLEKIKNDRIWKEQDSETKKRIRKDNAELAAAEADAIHSYLTGEDNIDALDNKSFLDNRLPGGLFIGRNNQLNIRQVQTNPNSKKTRLSRVLKRFKTMAAANIESARQIIILKKIFDKLNITFSQKEIKFDGKIQAGGYQSSDGQEGITEDYIVTDVIIEEVDGIDQTRYVRKRIIVKDGLIVDQQIIS